MRRCGGAWPGGGRVDVADVAARGFTLFEVLTALAILAGAFVGVFAVFRTTSDVAQNARTHGAARETARVIRVLLARDLGSVFHPAVADRGGRTGFRFLVPGPSGSESTTATGDRVVVDMITLSRLSFDRDEPEAGVTRVRWLLRPRDEADAAFDLVRAELDDPQLLPSSLKELPWKETLLARGVSALDVTVMDERQAGRQDWDSVARERQGSPALPRMVVAHYKTVRAADDRSPVTDEGPAGSFTARLALPFTAYTAQGLQ